MKPEDKRKSLEKLAMDVVLHPEILDLVTNEMLPSDRPLFFTYLFVNYSAGENQKPLQDAISLIESVYEDNQIKDIIADSLSLILRDGLGQGKSVANLIGAIQKVFGDKARNIISDSVSKSIAVVVMRDGSTYRDLGQFLDLEIGGDSVVNKNILAKSLFFSLQNKNISTTKIATFFSPLTERAQIAKEALVLALDQDETKIQLLLKFIKTLPENKEEKIIIDAIAEVRNEAALHELRKIFTNQENVVTKIDERVFQIREQSCDSLAKLLADSIIENGMDKAGGILSRCQNLLTDKYSSKDQVYDEMVIVCSKAVLLITESYDGVHDLIKSVFKGVKFDSKSSMDVGADILSLALCGVLFGEKKFSEEKKETFLKGICGIEGHNVIIQKASKDLEDHGRKDLVSQLNGAAIIAKVDIASNDPHNANAKALDAKKVLLKTI